MDEPDSFGGWIRRRRKALDLTREALAAQVGCATVTIRKIEADERRPSRQIAERLATCLAIPPEDQDAFLRAARAELAVARLSAPPTPESPPLPRPRARPPPTPTPRGYQLHEQIGSGGFATVYRATQPGVSREVAIKVIAPRLANQPEFIRRFEAEARLVARLEHPHIVPLYDYWREHAGAYLVMRYMRGGSVQAALTAPWPLERCTRVLEDVGPALAFAHRHGVIHRDLKPANLLLDDEGHVYLADFGIAKELTLTDAEEVTQAAAIVGTPEYLSPEQLRDEPLSPATDIYSLGVLLYVLLAGAHPLHRLTPAERLAHQLATPLPPLTSLRPELPSAVETVLQHATTKAPTGRYQEVAALITDWRRAIADAPISTPRASLPAADEISAGTAPTEVAAVVVANPYKGLRAFEEGDADDFFGREELTRRLIERMAEGEVEADRLPPAPAADPQGSLQPTTSSRFLAVVGPSGSGKSSVVRAGLIPTLRRGALSGSEQWFYAELLPGAHPLEELEAALLRVAVNPPEQLLGQLSEDERGLLRAIKRVLPADPAIELVLVVDQFEEIFTLVEAEAARAHLLASLVAAVSDPRSRLRLIITLRADFYDRPLLYPGLADLLRLRTELVLPLSAPELRRAIVGPAEGAGLAVDADLVAMMIRDVSEQPGGLPLLQYTLTELYERRDGPALTIEDYQDSGGVVGALARRADSIYERLSPGEQQQAHRLFLRLITPGEGTEDTRRRVRLSEFAAGDAPISLDNPVFRQYGSFRLLTFDRDPLTREPTVEVAHEALIRSWGRLRDWLRAGRDELRIQRRLTAAAAEWAASDRDPSYLASGARLLQFTGLEAGDTSALNAEEREFLEASLAAAARTAAIEEERRQGELRAAQQLAATEAARAEEQQQAATRLRQRAYGLAGALTAALILASVALYFGVIARRNQQAAEAASRVATSRELAAAAINNLVVDPERSILLALHALEVDRTRQASDALHQAVMASRVQRVISNLSAAPPILTNVLFSPDGALGVVSPLSFTSPLTTTIFDTSTGAVIYSIPGFSPSLSWRDARRLVTEHPPAENLTLTVWETGGTEARATSVVTLPVPFAELLWYEVSPDFTLVAVDRRDAPVIVYSMEDGREIFTTDEAGSDLSSPAFSSDGTYLAAATADYKVQVWQLSPSGPNGVVSFSPAYGTATRPLRGPTTNIGFLSFSPDGSRLAAVIPDGTISVWDLSNGESSDDSALPAGQTDPRLRFTLRGHTNDVRFAAWSPDGSRLATSSQDRKIIIWDMRNGAQQMTLAGHTGSVSLLAFSADGTRLISGSDDNSARIWDITPPSELRAFTAGPATSTNYMLPMALSRDGRRIITGNPEITAPVKIFDATTGAEVVELPNGDDRTAGVALSADGSRAATASGGFDRLPKIAEPAVAVWDGTTGTLIRRFPYEPGFISVALSPDGTRVAATAFDATVHLWDVATGEERILANSGATIEDWPITFSPDGTRIAAGAFPGSGQAAYIDVWNTVDGRHLLRLEPHDDRIFKLEFDQNGSRLASVSRDGTVRIWDLSDGSLLQTMVGHTSTVMGVAWSPDGTKIASAAYDLTIRLWDVATGEELRSLSSPSGPSDVAFSPDGNQLYAASVDGVVRVYLTSVDDLITLARSRVTRELTTEECAIYLHSEHCPGPSAAER